MIEMYFVYILLKTYLTKTFLRNLLGYLLKLLHISRDWGYTLYISIIFNIFTLSYIY